MKRLSITVPKPLEIKVRDLSKETGLTISDLLRRAIELYIKNYDK